ncbi:flagellar assembly protein FliW [Desulforamulus ferrireducens]|uniref:Flagellar assembly factor FliW n=1 Tax=Desulforamulus ferrireducens TaxID=1833852 RepID=A0A1S6IYH2_9FIRM|nr:flagellar assembly protein FliW [Desulforamulus ferrireducens]AQS59834.1 flagellar assembly protein FliW [Desulforamulus ferrireducens]
MDKIIFPQGLPGFENLSEFSISPLPETPFYYLESLEDENICFLLVNPFDFSRSYEFEIPAPVEELLQIKELNEVTVFTIVNTSQGLEKATVNLQAPIIINVTNGRGMQVVLNDPSYKIREPLHSLVQGAVK